MRGRFRGIERIHFVGIGGIGMCGLAELLRAQGYEVTGSDLAEGATVARLRALGVAVAIGHDARHVGRADVVVVSTAVRAGKPGGRRSRAPRGSGDPARRDAGRGHAPQGRHRHRRHARQDHDHLAGRRTCSTPPASTRPS